MTLIEKIAIILNSDNSENNKYALHVNYGDVKSKDDFFLLLNSIPCVVDKIMIYKEQIDKHKIREQKTYEIGSTINILKNELEGILNALIPTEEMIINNLSGFHSEQHKSYVRIRSRADKLLSNWNYEDDFHKKCKIATLKTFPKRINNLFSIKDLPLDNKNIENISSLNLNKNMYVISSSYFSKNIEIDELEKCIFPIFDKEGIKINKMVTGPTYTWSNNIDNDFDMTDIEETNEGGEIKYYPDLTEFNIFNKSISEKLTVSYFKNSHKIELKETEDFLNFLSKNGKPFLLTSSEANNFRIFKSNKNIPFSINFKETNDVQTLGEIESVNGDLGFSNSKISSLGNLKSVEGDFWIARDKENKTQLTSLENLEYVGGNLMIKNSPIKSLGKLSTIKGTLNLRLSQISDLENVKEIGNHLYLPKDLKGKIKYEHISIGGKVKYFPN